LGLDWTIPQELQTIRDREDEIRKLKQAVGEGELGDIIGKRAELRSELAKVEAACIKLRERITSFNVLPAFRDMEGEASALTQTIGDLSNGNTLDDELTKDLERSLSDEKIPESGDLGRLYEQAGIVLPNTVLKRFDDVRRFHESVVSNRRTYLQSEIESARQRIRERETRKTQLDGRRRELMGILRSHGALDQLTNLQSELAKQEAHQEILRRRFDAAERLETAIARLKIERNQILLRLQQDYSEQNDLVRAAIVSFQEVSERLYEKPATLVIRDTSNGPEFDVEVQGERSPGISNMQIFCFDMMLMRVMAQRKMGPGFLVHDSHLFDPVDGRQVGLALQIGGQLAEEFGFQYIVTMNSDQQIELPEGFDLNEHVLPTKLTDATETGGLFGLRFG
jgi:uncharacterized protein YydD (DUF2326 family)